MKLTFLTLLLLISALLFSSELHGKKFYKHVDEKGIIHYSDKPPEEDVEFESWQVRVEDSKYEVQVVNRGTKRSPIFYAINPYHGPVEIAIGFTSQHNVVATPSWPAKYVLPANSDIYLSTIKPINKNQSWSFQYTVDSSLGDPNATPDQNHPYLLPFKANKNYFISQGFDGEFTHNDEQNRYAIDIAMPVGTEIHAARAGVVMDIAEDFYDGGTDNNNMLRGNYIRIVHDDGTMAIYAHLKLESVFVARGQRVEARQKIALSGNTGFTSGPHLHFAIQFNQGLRLVSVPFKLKHKSGEVKTPEIGPI